MGKTYRVQIRQNQKCELGWFLLGQSHSYVCLHPLSLAMQLVARVLEYMGPTYYIIMLSFLPTYYAMLQCS